MRHRSFEVEYFEAKSAFQAFRLTTDAVPVPVQAAHTKLIKILIQEVRRLMKANKVRAAFIRVSRYLQREMDRIHRFLEEEHGKIEIVCEDEFCIQCCRRPIYLRRGLEERAVKGAIRGLPPGVRTKIALRAEYEASLLSQAAQVYGLDGHITEDLRGMVDGEYARMGGICPMMDGSGTCLLEKAQPFSCSMVAVIGHPCYPGGQAESLVFPHLMALLDEEPIKGTTIPLLDVIRQGTQK